MTQRKSVMLLSNPKYGNWKLRLVGYDWDVVINLCLLPRDCNLVCKNIVWCFSLAFHRLIYFQRERRNHAGTSCSDILQNNRFFHSFISNKPPSDVMNLSYRALCFLNQFNPNGQTSKQIKKLLFNCSSSPNGQYHIQIGNVTWTTRCRTMKKISECGSGVWELLMRINGSMVWNINKNFFAITPPPKTKK